MKSMTKAIAALILVAGVLLVSDLQNRNRGAAIKSKVKYKLALVHYVDSHNSEDCEKGIRQALTDSKLVENENFTLKVLNAQGDISTLNSIAGTLGNEKWDLVLCTSTPTIQLFAKKLPDQKIVFTNVGDPLAAGLGETFEKHLPNITGISTMSDFDGQIRLINFLKPGVKKLGTVFTPAEINSVAYKNRLEEAAKQSGMVLVSVPANTATEVLDAAHSLVSQQIDAFCQISDNLTGSCSSAILKVSRESKVPYFGFVSQQLGQGAVAVCARDYYQAGYEAGIMGMEVLKGLKPSDIPYRCVAKTDFLLSGPNAAIFGIRVPQLPSEAFPTLRLIQ